MNQQINSPQPPARQPVSIHDSAYKHHGALPLITAMLGVLLVIETIVFGYVITQYVDLQNQQEVILAKRAEVAAAKIDAPVVTPGKECSDTLLSNLVFNPPVRPFGGDDGSTWLKDKLEPTDKIDSCTSFGFNVDDSAVTDTNILEALGTANTDPSLKNLTQIMKRSESVLYKVCQGTEDTYAVLLNGNIATLLTYDAVLDAWQRSQPVGGVIDGVISVYTDFFGTGSPLLETGYGDGGLLSWRYWVPTEAGATQLLESCVAGTGLKGYEDSEQEMMSCDLEYVP